MLKHRSESRNSFFNELEISNVEENSEINILHDNDDGDNGLLDTTYLENISLGTPISNTSEIVEKSSSNADGISILLTKPTIKKIIERRKSELPLKENIDVTLKESKKKIKEDQPRESIEEIQRDNSTIVIHRRKREHSSDTSSESGIASQVSETNNQNSKAEENGNEVDLQKDFWKFEPELPLPPLASSSPSKVLKNGLSRSQEYLNSTQSPSSPHVDCSYGYSTLDGRFRKKNLHLNSPSMTSNDLKRLRQRNRELDRIRESTDHVDRISVASDMRYRADHRIGQSHTLDRRTQKKSYLNETPLEPRYKRPQSVDPEMLRYNTCSPNSNSLLLPANSLKNFHRNENHRSSCYSVSANSSVSNIYPQSARSVGLGTSVSKSLANSDCPCGTLGRRAVLEKINEDLEQERELHEVRVRNPPIYQNKCKYFTVFLIVLNLMACMLGGILLRFVGYYPQSISLNQGDSKIVQMSSLFCDGLTVSSQTTDVRAISFKQRSRRLNSTHYSRKEELTVYPIAVWKRKFYLLKHSTIKFTIKTDQPVDVMTFDSQHKYDVWFKRKASKTYLNKERCCLNTKEKQGHVTITANQDGFYLIAIHNSEELFPIVVNVHLTASRFMFDFAETKDSCKAEKTDSCTVDYKFDTDDEIALEVPIDRTTPDKISQSSEIVWQCKARIWFYFVVFAFTALLITILLISFYFLFKYITNHRKCCFSTDKKQSRHNFQYYDNFGRTSSDICTSDNGTANTSKNYLHSSRNGIHASTYADTASESSRAIRNLFQPKASTLPRQLSSRAVNLNNNIASIYNEAPLCIDAADSGISEPNFSPPGQKNVDAHELLHYQEMQFQYLKALRNHQVEVSNGPSIRELLNRPKSVNSDSPYFGGYSPEKQLRYRQEMNRRGFYSTYSLDRNYEGLHITPDIDFFSQNTGYKLKENGKDLSYDHREIYL